MRSVDDVHEMRLICAPNAVFLLIPSLPSIHRSHGEQAVIGFLIGPNLASAGGLLVYMYSEGAARWQNNIGSKMGEL